MARGLRILLQQLRSLQRGRFGTDLVLGPGQWVKDLELVHLWHKPFLRLWNFHMPRLWPLKKKKKSQCHENLRKPEGTFQIKGHDNSMQCVITEFCFDIRHHWSYWSNLNHVYSINNSISSMLIFQFCSLFYGYVRDSLCFRKYTLR